MISQRVDRSTQWTMPIVIGLLLLAFVLRVWAIDSLPPGLTHDEVSQLDTAAQVRAGDWRLLYPGGFAQDGAEPGYYPFLAASQAIWGENSLGRRLPSIFAGMIGLACIYALAVRLFGRRVGLIALGMGTVVWWAILLSRVILREVLEIPLYALTLYAFWRGFEAVHDNLDGHVPLRPFVLGGVALGLLQYVHTIPRGLFAVFIVFGAYLLVWQRTIFKRVWHGILVLVILAELIAAPLLITAALNPDLDNKPTIIGLPLSGADGLVQRFQANAPWVLGQFMFAGDDGWEFNIPYRPIFEPLSALLFALGVASALWRFRRPAMAFVLIALGVSLLPSIFLKTNFTFGRLASAQTVVFAFVGLGAETIGAAASRLIRARARLPLAVGLLTALLAIGLFVTLRDMYVTWPADPQTRSTYNAELRDLSRYLDAQPTSPPIAQCVLWIIYPWRPRYHLVVQQAALPYFIQRRDVEVRWHDCRYSLVIPSGGQFIFAHSDLEPLGMFLGRFLQKPWLTNARPLAGLSGALQIDARAALAQQQLQWNQLTVTWPPEATTTSTAKLPINFDHAVNLIGYKIVAQSVKPGKDVAVITYWRVTGSLSSDLTLFTHLYRTPTEVLAQQDQLDVAPDSLQPGDVFIQQHEFITIPPDTPAGPYWLGVGLYHRNTGQRLPIEVGDQPVADRIFLTQVQVQP